LIFFEVKDRIIFVENEDEVKVLVVGVRCSDCKGRGVVRLLFLLICERVRVRVRGRTRPRLH
jgi:hypothetical protein